MVAHSLFNRRWLTDVFVSFANCARSIKNLLCEKPLQKQFSHTSSLVAQMFDVRHACSPPRTINGPQVEGQHRLRAVNATRIRAAPTTNESRDVILTAHMQTANEEMHRSTAIHFVTMKGDPTSSRLLFLHRGYSSLRKRHAKWQISKRACTYKSACYERSRRVLPTLHAEAMFSHEQVA